MGKSIIRQFNSSIIITAVFYMMTTVILYVFVVDKNINELREEILLGNAKEIGQFIDDYLEEEVDSLALLARNYEVTDWMESHDLDVEFSSSDECMTMLKGDYLYIAAKNSGDYFYTVRENGQYQDWNYYRTMDEQNPDDKWFYETVNLDSNGYMNNYDINVEKDLYKQNIVFWINYRVEKDGVILGVIGTSIPIENILNKVIDTSVTKENTYLIDEYGSIQMAYDEELIMFNSYEDENNDDYHISRLTKDKASADQIDVFLASKEASGIISIRGSEFTSIVISKIPSINWSVVGLYHGEAIIALDKMFLAIAGFMFALFLFMIAYLWFIRRKIIEPIHSIKVQIDEYNQNKSINEIIHVDNELGDLAVSLVELEKENYEAEKLLEAKVKAKENEVHRLYSSIKESELFLKRFLDSLPIGVIRIDSYMELTYMNAIAMRIMEVDSHREYDEQKVRNPQFPFKSKSEQIRFMNDLTSNQSLVDYRMTFSVGKFKEKVVLMNVYPVIIDQITYYEGIVKDVTKSLNYEKRLIKRANYDNLTDVLSRPAFISRLHEIIRYNMKQNKKCYFLTLDFDYFKQVNDTFGHLAGDKVLVETMKVIKEFIGENSLLGRIGGDEFSGLIQFVPEDEILAYLDRIRQEVENATIIYDHFELNITISIGYTVCIQGDDFKKLYYRSDQALYKAKELGKNKVIGFEETEKVDTSND